MGGPPSLGKVLAGDARWLPAAAYTLFTGLWPTYITKIVSIPFNFCDVTGPKHSEHPIALAIIAFLHLPQGDAGSAAAML